MLVPWQLILHVLVEQAHSLCPVGYDVNHTFQRNNKIMSENTLVCHELLLICCQMILNSQ